MRATVTGGPAGVAGACPVEVHSSFEAARPAWTALQASTRCHAFQTYEWLSGWYRFVGHRASISLSICTVYGPSGAPWMLLPLGVETGGPCATLRWLGGTITDYHGPLIAEDYFESGHSSEFPRLWRMIRQQLPEHHLILLEKQPELLGERPNPFAQLECLRHASSAHFAVLEGSFDEFVEHKRGPKTRRTERRKERRLRDQGNLRFQAVLDGDSAAPALEVMMAQKSRSYREMGVTDLFADPAVREFVSHMTREHCASGLVHFSTLTLNEQILASHWGLVYGARFYFLFPTYARNELTRYSPGNVLLLELFKWAMGNDVRLFDFTVGDEAYKSVWADGELRLYDHVEAASLYGTPYAMIESIRRRLKRRIKRSPALFAGVKRLRARVASMKPTA